MNQTVETDIILIAAISRNYVIGKDGGMAWHLPEDLKFFKQTTLGLPIIMGSVTWKSLGCKPLPKRYNIVVSTQKDFVAQGAIVFNNLSDATEYAKQIAQKDGTNKVMIIGGAKIYESAIPYCNKIILTEIQKDFDGTSFFPIFNKDEWNATLILDKNDADIPYKIFEYKRINTIKQKLIDCLENSITL